MNTAQAYGQRLRPVQETGIEKAEPLLSIQQSSIDHSIYVMIDSSGLVMDNGNSSVGSIEEIFTRLTRRLVFKFLGGHARMEELPCLGGLTNRNDEFHRITPSQTFSKSSQSKLLDSTGNLHPSSIVFMNSDFNPRIKDYLCESVLLDSFDASSTTFISSLEQFPNELISQPADHTIEGSLQCSPINIAYEETAGLMTESSSESEFFESQVSMESDGFPNGIDFMSASFRVSSNQSDKENSKNPVSKTVYPVDGANIFDTINAPVSSIKCIHLGSPCNNISTDVNSPTFSIPDPKYLNYFLYGTLKFPMFLASELPDEKLDTFDYPSLHEDFDPTIDSDVADLSDNKFNNQFNGGVFSYDEKTSDTPGGLIGLEDGSSSGDYKDMEISIASKIPEPYYTGSLGTHWPTGVDSSFFDVSNHEELLESYGLNNQDQYTDIVHVCASPTWPGKVDAAWEKAIQMNLTDLDTNENSLGRFYDENMKNSVSSTRFNQRECALNTSSYDVSEDYLFQVHPCSDGFRNSIEESIIGTTENPLVYAVPHPDTLNEYLYGSLKSPMFLTSERIGTKFDRQGSPSFYGDCYSDDCADAANSSDKCNVELFDSDCSRKDPIAFPLEFSDHYELLETCGVNIQDQYTDTGSNCASPTWPEKMITLSKGQTQKPLTCLIPNLTKDDTANGMLTTGSSLFHSNTDQIAAKNKNWTDEIYERNSENSVSLCHLNQVECAFETSFLLRYDSGSIDYVPLLHACSDDFEDSIEHQSHKNGENELKFAFPDPSTLKDFFFGSLGSPKFLASELLDGKINTLDYPSLFGDCELDHEKEEADLSEKMIFDQFCDMPGEDSINKFLCSIQLLGLIPSSFDISDHDELLEWYGINDQDQFMDDNWMCDSPTWPGKI